jgi:hypothetical protein
VDVFAVNFLPAPDFSDAPHVGGKSEVLAYQFVTNWLSVCWHCPQEA